MYLDESMIELTRADWRSPLHRYWSVAVCIGNPLINTLDEMNANVAKIQALTDDEISAAKVGTMVKIGCTI